jgi:hypothetical protein
MPDQEYTDGYQQEHPELIPGNRTEAHLWISAAIVAGIEKCDTQTFLKAWWAFAWLNPGFHPDDYRQSDLPNAQEFTEEAFRRAAANEIEDDVVYACEATHNAVWLERCGSPYAPSGFTDGYIPRHPQLIPANEAEAYARLAEVSPNTPSEYTTETFLAAWWALFWLNPGNSPEYHDEWEDQNQAKLAVEAYRRYDGEELTDEEMFPCEVCHARILAEREQGTLKHGMHAYDRMVVIRTDDGQYLSRAGGVTPEKRDAARYYMIADRVADQIDTVKKLYGRTMTTEAGR